MNCNKKSLFLLVDGELGSNERQKVLNHMKECITCNDEYHKIINMRKLVSANMFSEDLDLLLEGTKSKKCAMPMRRKAAAASAAALLIAILFIPVNGYTLAATIQNWVNELNFKSSFTDYKVTTDLKPMVIIEDEKEDIKTPETKSGFTRAAYGNLEEATAGIPVDFSVPVYIPKGFGLDEVEYINDGYAMSLVSFHYRSHVQSSPGSKLLSIGYEYMSKDIPNREIGHTEGTQVKETTLLGYPAYFSYSHSTTSLGLNVMVGSNELNMVRIRISIPGNLNEANLADAQKELVTIAESILQP